jgi:hypothetical protein
LSGGERAGRPLAAGASGPNAALAQFQAQNAGSAMAAQAGQDAAIARIQEQYNAQNLLGLTLHGGRQADENVNLENMRAQLEMYGLTDRAVIQALQSAGQLNGGPANWERIAGGAANALGLGGAASAAGLPSGPQSYGGSGSPGAGGGWY